jgi:hypothetical protein
MADKYISQLTTKTLAATDELPIATAGATGVASLKKTTVADIVAFGTAFTEHTGTSWDGSNKFRTLTGNLALTLSTDKVAGLLYITGNSSYTLTINGVAITINNTGDSIVGFIKQNGNFVISTDLSPVLLTDVSYDDDAQAFFDNVSSAGGSLSTPQKNAINTFVLSLKADGIYSTLGDFGLCIGGNAASHALGFKGVKTLGFSGSWTHSATGSVPAVLGAYATTGIIPSADMSLNNFAISLWSRTASGASVDVFGACDLSNDKILRLFVSTGANGFLSDAGSVSQRATATVSDTVGLFSSIRSSSTQLDVCKNGAIVGSNTSAQTGAAPDIDLNLNCIHGNTTASAPVNFSMLEITFWGYGTSRSGAQETDLYNALNTLMTALSR